MRRRHVNDRDPHRPLRIGYVTLFYGGSPTNYFMERVLTNHGHARFHVTDYSVVAQRDEATEAMAALTDRARDVSTLSDDAMVERVRADEIDILIDTIGHLRQNRLTALARKPAPVQVSYLGHCATTGMEAFDYRINDTVTDPDRESPPRYRETVIRLPSGFCCYAPPAAAPEAALPASSRGVVTFGSLHKLDKLSEPVIELWCQLLRRVPNARLLVFRDTLRGRTAERLRARSPQRYLEIAAGVAADIPALVELRRQLRPLMATLAVLSGCQPHTRLGVGVSPDVADVVRGAELLKSRVN